MTDQDSGKSKTGTGTTGTPGAGDDKSGVAGKGSDQRPASHMERPSQTKTDTGKSPVR